MTKNLHDDVSTDEKTNGSSRGIQTKSMIQRVSKRTLGFGWVLAFVFLCGLGGPQVNAQSKPQSAIPAAQDKNYSSTQPAQPLSSHEIGNFFKISDTLYRGAQPSKKGIQELKELGVKTLINFRSLHTDDGKAIDAGMVCEHIPMHPWNRPKDENVIRFLQLVTDTSKQPVFVHCSKGRDRTGMMIAVYRIVIQGWTKQEAISEMNKLGYHSIWGTMKKYINNLDVQKMKEAVATAQKTTK